MKPASFDLFQPLDWSETLNALKNYGKDAKILAGGQSLIAMMNMRIAKPKVLIEDVWKEYQHKNETNEFDESLVFKGIGEKPNNFLAYYFHVIQKH